MININETPDWYVFDLGFLDAPAESPSETWDRFLTLFWLIGENEIGIYWDSDAGEFAYLGHAIPDDHATLGAQTHLTA